jgi:hypothetical protein
LLIFAHILQRRCSTTPSVETPPTLPERSLGENGQLAYHQGNKRIMGRIDHRLHYFGLVWFGTTFLSLAPFLVPACLMVPPKYMAASVRTKLSAITCGVGWRRPQRVQKNRTTVRQTQQSGTSIKLNRSPDDWSTSSSGGFVPTVPKSGASLIFPQGIQAKA